MSEKIENNLIGNEKILARARVSKVFYLLIIPPVLLFPIALFTGFLLSFIIFCAVLFVSYCAWSFVEKTDIVLTNKRLIVRYGYLSNMSFEQDLRKIEGLDLIQAPIPRLLGVGSFLVRGIGGGKTAIPLVGKPDDFRRTFYIALSAANQS